jgi:hypothetical protein
MCLFALFGIAFLVFPAHRHHPFAKNFHDSCPVLKGLAVLEPRNLNDRFMGGIHRENQSALSLGSRSSAVGGIDIGIRSISKTAGPKSAGFHCRGCEADGTAFYSSSSNGGGESEGQRLWIFPR